MKGGNKYVQINERTALKCLIPWRINVIQSGCLGHWLLNLKIN